MAYLVSPGASGLTERINEVIRRNYIHIRTVVGAETILYTSFYDRCQVGPKWIGTRFPLQGKDKGKGSGKGKGMGRCKGKGTGKVGRN